jgi:hypothetical protein
MTRKQVKGKGFGGALRYNLDKVDRNVAEVLDHNFARVSARSIMKEIDLVRMHRPNLQKFFYHTSINFPPSENLSSEKMNLIGKEYLEMNGFTQHQYIMFRHFDAEHPHLHILVNRIGYDGSVVSDSNDYARSERIIRELEKKYGLQEVISSKQAKERSLTPGEIQMMKRIGDPSQKVKIQAALQNLLNQPQRLSLSEFVKALKGEGVNVSFNQAKTGYVSGISYELDGFVITGSKLGNAYKWTTLKDTLDYNQDRDGLLVNTINERSNNKTEKLLPQTFSDGTSRSRTKSLIHRQSSKSIKHKSKILQKLFPTPNEPGPIGILFHAKPGKIESVATEDYYLDHRGIARKKRKRGRSI